ncbi:MAG: hypothetical protein KIT73_03240 [Burkholderiales bacterium]|nr:hypothetical protein [Burkholderiales bacterium]
MSATVSYPFIAPLDSPEAFGEYVLNQFESSPLTALSGFLGNAFLLKQDLVNSWARAVDNDSNADISIAGAVDFQHRNAFATIDVMGGAQINQNASYRSDTQGISLNAETELKMINVGGIFDYDLSPEGIIKSVRSGPSNSLQPFGAQGGKAAFGGAYRQLDLNSTTHAIIHGTDADGTATSIYTAPNGELSISAYNDVFVLGILQSGAESGQFGVSGSAAYTQQTADTVAAIEAGAVIEGGGVSVDAEDTTVMPTYVGDVIKGKNLGLGASIVYNDINRNTQAYVGAPTGVTPEGGDMNVTSLDVSAINSGRYIGIALAAAVADNDETAPGGTFSASAPNPNNPSINGPVNPSPAPAVGHYGVAVSGDVVFNQVSDTTLAVVNLDATLNVARYLSVSAENDTELLALTGSAAIAEGESSSAGLAGSYSENVFDATTLAEIRSDSGELTLVMGVNPYGSESVVVSAIQGGFATAVAAGGSGGINHADGSAEIAGSVAINRVTPATEAHLTGTSITTAGDIKVTAADAIPIYALAGAASFGGKQGIGASIALNITHNDSVGESVAAQIRDSRINQSGTGVLVVDARITDPSDQDRIVAVAGSLGQGSSVGVSGTVAMNDLGVPSGNAVEASITGSDVYASTDPSASVTVNAVLDQTLIAVGGEVALSTGKSSTFSLGAGVAYNQTDLPVQAFVESSNLTAQKLSITASIDGRMTATSAGLGVSTNGTGVAGSAGVNTVNDRVTAFIDGLSSTQSVDVDGATLVSASHGADFTAAAGELAAGTNSGGAAVSVNDIRTSTQAYIGVATVNGGGTVAVTADTTGEVTGVAVGAEGGQNFTLGASIAVNAVDTTTEAWVAGTDDTSGAATVVTPGSVNVAAQSDLSFITAAGTLAAAAQFFPGGGAVGVANATLLRTDRTQAWVRNSSVSFGGTNSPIDIKTASAGALQDDPDFTGLSVTAVSTDTITSASGGASIAPNENLAGAGSVTVTMVDKATQALVGDGVSLPSTNAVDVNVLAYDDTHVGSGAGALALLGQTGVGAGVDVVSLTKDTQALFAPEGDVTLSGGLSVQALSNEDLVSVALGASLLATTDIAGAASAYVLDLSTTAAIGDTDATDIIVGGSALLSAQDDTVLNQIPGGVSIGIDASVGAAVGVIDVKSKKVDAAIASGVSLTAHAGADRSAIEAATGEFAVGFVAPSGQNGDVPPPNVSIDTGKQTGDSNAPSIDNRNLHEERTAAPVFESTRGIAVSAINTGKFKSITFAVGGATTAAVDVDASVNVLKMDTTTRILPDVTLVSDGDVVLASGADLHKLGVTGSGAVSGTVSGAAGADVTLIDMTTKTEIAGGNTSIAAGADGDLIINAQAQEDILTITAGFAASAGVGLDVGATVIEVDNSTFAGVSSGVATMSAGGNVLVAAEDDTVTAAVTGDVAIGLTGGAFGGSTVVTLITKDTRAELFEGSAVDGLAHGTDTLVVPDGTYTGDNSGYNTKQLQGVAIQASSSEDVTGIAIGGGAGFYFGAGAAAVYTMIDSDTAAAVGANVAINQKSGASASQAVSITADNDAKAFTIGGGLGLGAVGIGAGVDVGKIHNDVDATIGSGSTVSATGEVDVFALGLNRLRSYALSAGAGAVGVDGSVSVWALGTGIESTYSDTQQSADALNYNKGGGGYSSAAASADGQTNRTDVTTLLGKYGNTGGANSGQVASLMAGSSTDYGAAQPNGAVQAAFADTSTSGVTAAIAQGAVIAAADLDVAAATTVVADQLAGGASVGIASVGASVSILNRGDTVQALMDGTVDVSGSIDVTAASFGYANSTAAGGTLGAVALGAQVAMVHDASAVSAFVGVEADIQRADQGLNVGAATVADLTGWAYGVDIGVVAGGVGVVDISSTGSTTAQLASASVSAAAVSVTADSTVTTNGTSDASAGGIGASAVGNVTTVTVSPQVSASIDSGTVAGRLDTPGDVEVAAYSSVNSTAMSNGYSLGIGLSAAASFATAVVDGSVEAYVGAGNTVNAGNVKVLADADETVVATSTANAGYTLIGSGEGTVATATITDTIAAYARRRDRGRGRDDPGAASGNRGRSQRPRHPGPRCRQRWLQLQLRRTRFDRTGLCRPRHDRDHQRRRHHRPGFRGCRRRSHQCAGHLDGFAGRVCRWGQSGIPGIRRPDGHGAGVHRRCRGVSP